MTWALTLTVEDDDDEEGKALLDGFGTPLPLI
jgi:hypothetical protein